MRHVVRAVVEPCLALVELGQRRQQLALRGGDDAVQLVDTSDQLVRAAVHARPVPGEEPVEPTDSTERVFESPGFPCAG
jgi:hypothetical protein